MQKFISILPRRGRAILKIAFRRSRFGSSKPNARERHMDCACPISSLHRHSARRTSTAVCTPWLCSNENAAQKRYPDSAPPAFVAGGRIALYVAADVPRARVLGSGFVSHRAVREILVGTARVSAAVHRGAA